ncbi:hypothetical protein Tco_0301141 [Tanacetum coccineum]
MRGDTGGVGGGWGRQRAQGNVAWGGADGSVRLEEVGVCGRQLGGRPSLYNAREMGQQIKGIADGIEASDRGSWVL